MNNEQRIISAACAMFVCRVCRTKTGWPHQQWCGLAELTQPECKDCRYWNDTKLKCEHPSKRKGGGEE